MIHLALFFHIRTVRRIILGAGAFATLIPLQAKAGSLIYLNLAGVLIALGALLPELQVLWKRLHRISSPEGSSL